MSVIARTDEVEPAAIHINYQYPHVCMEARYVKGLTPSVKAMIALWKEPTASLSLSFAYTINRPFHLSLHLIDLQRSQSHPTYACSLSYPLSIPLYSFSRAFLTLLPPASLTRRHDSPQLLWVKMGNDNKHGLEPQPKKKSPHGPGRQSPN